MPDYIVCRRKRNNPRIDVRVCEQKCPLKEECKDYTSLHTAAHQPKEGSLSAASPTVELEAA